jgi:hypothetical protein
LTVKEPISVITRRGYLGLASPTAIVGDLVLIADGSEVPLMGRKIPVDEGWRMHAAKCRCASWVEHGGNGGPDLYEFIGLAYIHGTMDGEAWTECTAERGELRRDTVFMIS